MARLWALVMAIGCCLPGCSKQSNLSKFESKEWKFNVLMPASPMIEKKKFGDTQATMFSVVEADGMFSIDCGALIPPGLDGERETQEYFDEWRDNFLARADRNPLEKDEKFLWQRKYSGREFVLMHPEKQSKQQVRIIKGQLTFYNLQVIGKNSWKGWTRAREFLESFEILP